MLYRDYWPKAAKWLDEMRIKPERWDEFVRMARYAIANKDIYQAASNQSKCKCPWPWFAVTHKRESDAQDKEGNPLFTSYLGNGQPLWVRTTIVPEDRGPFITRELALSNPAACRRAFLKGCQDAIEVDGMEAQVEPWPIEKLFYWTVKFNGWGYDLGPRIRDTNERHPPMPSPYGFGGTSIQVRGKYTRDGYFDPDVWDTQLGCAGMFWMIGYLDKTVQYTRES